MAAQGNEDDLDPSDVLFKTLSSSPTLRFVISHRSRLRFSPSLQLRWGTPEPDYTSQIVRIPNWSSALASPTTSEGFPSPFLSPSFPASDRSTESNAAPLMPRLHLRLNPHPRTQFSILSVSITAHSPLTFSPPIYRTFSTSRAFIPRAINNR